MYKKGLIFSILLLGLWTGRAWGDVSKGVIYFFPDQELRPQNDQFEVTAGQNVDVCVKVNEKSDPLLQELVENTTGFRLVLEDSKVPPNAIVVEEEPKKNYLKPDARGCYLSRFQIPPLTEEGVYQVADLLFKIPGRGFVSIHQILYEFSHADELLVHNPASDTEKPALVQINTLQKQTKKIGKAFDFYKIKVKQEFTFEETGSGLDPKSLKVFYRLMENNERTGIYAANCHKYFKKKSKFNCQLELTRPKFQWELNHLVLQLDSIYLQDKAGNQLVLEDQAILQKAAGDTPIQFEFEKELPGKQPPNPETQHHTEPMKEGSS